MVYERRSGTVHHSLAHSVVVEDVKGWQLWQVGADSIFPRINTVLAALKASARSKEFLAR